MQNLISFEEFLNENYDSMLSLDEGAMTEKIIDTVTNLYNKITRKTDSKEVAALNKNLDTLNDEEKKEYVTKNLAIAVENDNSFASTVSKLWKTISSVKVPAKAMIMICAMVGIMAETSCTGPRSNGVGRCGAWSPKHFGGGPRLHNEKGLKGNP